jgi:hypothetical protein
MTRSTLHEAYEHSTSRSWLHGAPRLRAQPSLTASGCYSGHADALFTINLHARTTRTNQVCKTVQWPSAWGAHGPGQGPSTTGRLARILCSAYKAAGRGTAEGVNMSVQRPDIAGRVPTSTTTTSTLVTVCHMCTLAQLQVLHRIKAAFWLRVRCERMRVIMCSTVIKSFSPSQRRRPWMAAWTDPEP